MVMKSTFFSYRKQFWFLLFALVVSVFSFSQGQNHSLFQPTDVPANLLRNDGQGLEVGVRFQSTENGFVTGIRYYKGAGTTGIHIGHLWTNTGTMLAEATFTNETASGWQQVLFSDPVAITAGVTYVASAYSPSGDYAFTNSYFTQAIINGPLRALADNEDGINGAYSYSSSPIFPTSGALSNNYWIDVVFNSSGPDVTPPAVLFVSPVNGATGLSSNTNITANFNEGVDGSSVTAETFQLKDAANNIVPSSVSASFNQIKLTPSSPLAQSTTYTITIKGDDGGVKDLAGNTMAGDYSWSFTTIGNDPFPQGQTILVISSVSNPFSSYTNEILKAEGLNAFTEMDISQVNSNELNKYDVVVIGEMSINPAQAALLTNWVNAGGVLIAFRPSAELSSLLGITKVSGSLAEGYLLVNTASGPGAGIVAETIQYHGTADLYTLNGATSLATLYSNANTATAFPAVTSMNVGSNGGKAVAFTYDLASSIVYTRQGNPAWAGQKRDGTGGPIRSDDLFFGGSEPDWVDFNKIAIPQADEQQHLLSNIIIQYNLSRKPLPRFWFLPGGHKAAIVMTGDDHAFNGTEGRFNQYLTLGPNSPQDVADWKAVRGTSYIIPGTNITNEQAAAFEAQGFEIALHTSTGCNDFTESSLSHAFSTQLGQLASQFPGLSAPITNRTHCLLWSDWATHPKVERQFGIRLDVNYYYWPEAWTQNRPGMFTGSGMPMRFADLDGSLIDCYQVPTQMTDETNMDYTSFCNQLLDKAIGPEGYYGVFATNMHTDISNHAGSNAIIASAQARRVPVVSAKQMLTWLDGRNGSYFGNMTWNNNQLSFPITALSGAHNLKAMLPFNVENGQLQSVTRNGSPISFSTQTSKGMQYAFFDVAIGTNNYVASYSFAVGSLDITGHPSSQTVCEGSTVSFVSGANGNPLPAVQWQSGTDGTNWINIDGANNSELSVTASATDNNRQYRAVWSNSHGTLSSDAATLTVKAGPVLTSPLTHVVSSGSPFAYNPSSSVAGTVFHWKRAAVTGVENPAATGTGNVHETLVNKTSSPVNVVYEFTLKFHDCISTQEVIVTVKPSTTGCVSKTSIESEFNSTKIRKGNYIWFNSSMKAGDFVERNDSRPVIKIDVTNSWISFKVNGQSYSFQVPDSRISFDVNVRTATARFTNGVWEIAVPRRYDGDVFMSGLAYNVPTDFPGNIRDIKWTADISMDKGVSLSWKWAAAVYTNFSSHESLLIKPVDSKWESIFSNHNEPGTPENYTRFLVEGATGKGKGDYTGKYSSKDKLYCKGSSNDDDDDDDDDDGSSGNGGLDIRVSPNPFRSHFNLEIRTKTSYHTTVIISDILGKVWERHENVATDTALQLGSKLKPGIYFVTVMQGGLRKTIIVIKTY